MVPLCIFLVLEMCQAHVDAHKNSTVHQYTGIIRAEVGKNVTLHCFCGKDATYLSWYRQHVGGNLQLIATRMRLNTEVENEQFAGRFHITAHGPKCINHLTIKDLQSSDSGSYFCGILDFSAIEFGQGTFLDVRTSTSFFQAKIQQPTAVVIPPGKSLNLSCTVLTESKCTGELGLYWIKYGKSEPVVTLPADGQCANPPKETPHIRSCSSKLEIQSASSSDAGMYYCALASCKEIVYGSGTRVEISAVSFNLLVNCLSVAFAVSLNALFVVIFLMYRLRKKLCSVCKGYVCRHTGPAILSQDGDSLHYAALTLKRNCDQSHQRNNMETVCVYSRVNTRRK